MVNDELIIIFGVFDDNMSTLMLKLFRSPLISESDNYFKEMTMSELTHKCLTREFRLPL
jgi:hypothetical protein